ncbi:MAG: NAD(P)H-dependent oxidoreductase [Bacteroidales bacterium]|jgi:chromate reductase|nr:NAD(P)H-dependent oxidoreductase [Bacteroidales bacterium]
MMTDRTVLALIGGISKDSLNRRLYGELSRLAPSRLVFKTCDIAALPFFSQDMETVPPPPVIAFRQEVRAADAVLLITPEYNRSFPGVLKNAIDWATRPYGQNLWKRKPAAIIGASTGKTGTFGAQQHLKNVCCFLDMRLMNQPEFYFDASIYMDDSGLTAEAAAFSKKFLAAFEQWIISE